MFYSDVILSKRGPLAKVWLAAHAERRLTKSQLIQTDIEQTVSSIIGPDVVPMALRLSGQLLLGVVRIYSRKTRYLLDDCNDALSKLKTAFRTGAIDFTTDTNAAAITADHNTVTLPVTRTGLDLGLPDPALEGWDAESSIGGDLPTSRRSVARSDRYTARVSDITLRRYFDPVGGDGNGESSGWASGEFFDPDASNGELQSPRPEHLQRRDSQGRLIDENGDLILAEERDDDVSSIGIGRDVQTQMGGARPSLTVGDLTGFDDLGMDQFLMPHDLGGESLDLGLEEFDAQRRSMTPIRQTRSSSVMLENLTPRTAIKVQQAAERRAQAAQKASRKQIIDSRTQLDDSNQKRQYTQGTEGIVLAQPTFLPATQQQVHLLELQSDPAKSVSPFIQTDAMHHSPAKQTFRTAKQLAPELTNLFTFDASAMLRRRMAMIEDVSQEDLRPQKRVRAEGEQDEEEEEEFASEIGRRAVDTEFQTGMGAADLTFDTMDDFDQFVNQPETGELTAMTGAGFDLGEDITFSQTVGLRRSQRKRKTGFEEEEIDQGEEEDRRRIAAFHQKGDLERLSTPEAGSVVGSSIGDDVSPTPSYPLRAFDHPSGGDTASPSATGLSRNTLRAVRVLKSHLPHPSEEEEAEEQSEIELSQITQNASRRAASAFFFEILALGTKDCIGVEQDEPYGEIKIKSKSGLWSLQRSGSVAA